MKSQSKRKDLMAPKPVHPTGIRQHGLFGTTFVKQHNIIDEKWTMSDLIDEFQGMTSLISEPSPWKRRSKQFALKYFFFLCHRQIFCSQTFGKQNLSAQIA